ncbi:ATP synthase F(0) complex subunit B1, mitochondrial [Thamnophis elegans]|uniref:ATP synthase F(0) complex subunit B1, mitochondrial n=1 Tax=Thamnophis elegans TaxID=35005 RepID=UPI00137906AF|nr:ATP synthase F(0) complex subunit B1, mitochondrial [Thamnophis elegans]
MLSRLALRALAPAALKSSVALPSLSSGIIHVSRSLHTNQQHLAPVPSLPEKGGKVRHGIIPEEFFQFLYPKTGVTGPYMLATGLTLYLLSKEIYVINHETIIGITVLSVLIYGIKKYGPLVAAFLDKKMDEELASYEDFKTACINRCQEGIEEEKKEQWRLDGRHYLFDAKRNNIAMILEANYRERLLTASREVKKRLDYQVALQNLKRGMERDHMINWVEQSVWKSVTAQQEKENIAKCLLDLKALSTSAQASL